MITSNITRFLIYFTYNVVQLETKMKRRQILHLPSIHSAYTTVLGYNNMDRLSMDSFP